MQTIKLSMAQALIRFLDNQYLLCDGQEYKFIDGVFGIFGHGNVTGLGEALENEPHQLKFMQAHHEQSMVHTAIAFAKQHKRRKIMACTASIGPGALNMVTGAATATTNRLPVLLLPGDIFACRQPDPVLQQLEYPLDYTVSVNDCFKPVSKFWDRINRPDQLMVSCLQAMRVLTDPIDTGAVTLCLPQDVQAEVYDYPESFFEKRVYRLDRTPLSEASLHQAIQLICAAKSPLIIAGGGVVYAAAENELAAFSSKLGIPVAVTQAGKGVMLESHPCYVGGIGVTGTEVANRLAKNADLIIALGTRFSDFTTSSKTAFQHPLHQILHFNLNPQDGFKLDGIFLKCDIQAGLTQLLHANALQLYKVSDTYQACIQDLQSNWVQEQQQVVKQPTQDSKLNQLAVLHAINNMLDPRDMIVCAAGSLPGDLHRFWQVKAHGTYHVEYAFSCMGYEVAGGLGVKLANPNTEVFVLVGDGSFLMMHSALLDSLQVNQKINIIVFDNQGYQCIQGLQKAHGSKGFGCDFNQVVDFTKLGEGLGVESCLVHTIDALQSRLVQIRKSQVSTLTVVQVSSNSMSHGYESGWRVGVPAVSHASKVVQAHESMKDFLKLAKPY